MKVIVDNDPNNNINDNSNTIKIENTTVSSLSTDELDILFKMENANREMETNFKSAQSILCKTNTDSSQSQTSKSSRRDSDTSFEVCYVSAEDQFTKNDEISWELWNQIIQEWNVWSKKRTNQLKDYIRKGIPLYLRPIVWQYLSGSNETNLREEYKNYLKKQSPYEKMIRRDIDRTYPEHDLFKQSNAQESLFNIMKAYSIFDPEVGYCQGSAFICGLLLIQNIPEEDAFAIFVQIMKKSLRDIYKPNMYHLGMCMYQLECLVEESLPDLNAHFIAHGFQTSMYSSSWFLTLFTTSLSLPLVCRLIDIFLNEGLEIIFRMALALLEFHKEYLMLLDMEGMLKVIFFNK